MCNIIVAIKYGIDTFDNSMGLLYTIATGFLHFISILFKYC